MKKTIRRFIDYCIYHEELSVQQARHLKKIQAQLEENGFSAQLYIELLETLGWPSEKLQAHLRKMDHKRVGLRESSRVETRVWSTQARVTTKTLRPPLSKRGMPLPQGKQFDKYILIKKIGAGAMGSVYQAYHPDLDSYYAIKILSAKVGPNGLKRFAREARVASKLKHPNIVQVHDVGVFEGKHYIVMDYIAGLDLRAMISQNTFLPRNALEIILHIAKALAYSHGLGIIHRDIKPPNIMIANPQEQPHPYLMDFGLASMVCEEGLTRTGQVIGTPQYMSPEQARGKEKLDGRSDIYALGVVLYEMLTGEPVVQADHIMAILYEVTEKEPPLLSRQLPGIAKDVEALVMKCIEKSPAQRYQNADELANDIERYLRGEAVLARSPGPVYRLWRKVIRNWKFSATVSILLLLLFGVGLWGLRRHTAKAYVSILEQATKLEDKGNLIGAANLYASVSAYAPARQGLDRLLPKIIDQAYREELQNHLQKAVQLYRQVQKIKYQLDIHHRLLAIQSKLEDKLVQIKTFQKQKDFERASYHCNELLRWFPEFPKALKLQNSIIQQKQRCRKEARKYYDQAMAIFWNPALHEKELRRCQKLFENAIKIDQSFADAHFQAGRAAQRLFENNQAIIHYQHSLRYNAGLTAASYYLTVLRLCQLVSRLEQRPCFFQKLKIYQKLQEVFAKIWPQQRQAPHDPYTLLAKAQCILIGLPFLKHNPNYESKRRECQKLCNLVLQQAPYFSDAYFVRAQLNSYVIKMRNGDPNIVTSIKPHNLNLALQDCSQGLYLDPLRIEGYALRAAIYQSIGAYELAEKDYTRALLLRELPKPSLYQSRALCYIGMSKYKLALQDVNKVQKLLEHTELDLRRLGEATLSKAMLCAMLGYKQQAEANLARYLARTEKYQHKLQFENFWKTMIYICIDENDIRMEMALKKFMVQTPQMFVFLKLVLTKQFASWGDPLESAKIYGQFMATASNIFCVPLKLKKFSQHMRQSMGSWLEILNRLQAKHKTFTNKGNATVVVRKGLEMLRTSPRRYQLLQQANRLVQQHYPPLTLELIFHIIDFFSQNQILQNLIQLKRLPQAKLYYRRAAHYYIQAQWPQARHDLESALDLEPNFMPAHYGLSTIYALLLAQEPNNTKYQHLALKHLQRAIELGWQHWRDWTMHDRDFQALHLEQHLEQLQSWERIRQENEKRLHKLRHYIKYLERQGKIIRALRLLYKSDFTLRLQDLIDQTEDKVMAFFKARCTPENYSKIAKQVKTLFGERGQIKWEWTWRMARQKSSSAPAHPK